ncbi:MAG: Gfo/Idh/MocA family oxidoreductase [Verrucomicrobia bacterium]|nr:Gfo/Idh/MocA family oxidoreductase [Verrucomicrobiota bacterium]
MKNPPASDITRRHFLAQTGLGLAAASTLSRAVAQGTAANSRLRLGLVGCGGRGKWILDLFAANGSYEIVAVADYFAERTAEAVARPGATGAKQFNGLKCAEKMIAAGGLDAVAIISPPYFHPAQAQAAVAAGLHVYLAKPVAVDVPGCQSIAESGALARKKGLVFLVDFQTRANEFFLEAMKRVHGGAMGDICFGESSYHAERLKAKPASGKPEDRLHNWVFDQILSGDIIVEQNIHTLDVMSWAMKDTPPVRCTGTGGRSVRVDVGDAWDHYALAYEYPNNVGVTFSSRQFDAHGTPGGIINRMFGTKGVLLTTYGGDVLIRGGAEVFYRGGSTKSIYKDGAVANIAAFHQRVLKKDAANLTVEPSVNSNLVAIMGRTAAQEKRTVTWSELIATKKKLQADLSGLVA